MTHQVLYRKYRPQNFKDVVGQDHVVGVLENSIKHGSISHAYLFYGSRGTGKTTIARIFARGLQVADSDIIEIDAASHTGVDNIRELREDVRNLPFESEYKIYILDEVHMLSKSAFNALLKTLEEPPRHVIFILATTEIEKIPQTILSRCQMFTFKDPTHAILTQHVQDIAKQESFDIDFESAELVAFLGDGSFRDTQSVLQKVFAYTQQKKLTYEEVAKILGVPPKQIMQDFFLGLIKKDMNRLFQVIQEAHVHTLDMRVFIKLLIQNLRRALLLRYAPEMNEEMLREFGGDAKVYQDLIKEKEGVITSKTLEVLLEAEQRQSKAFISTLPLELAVIKILEN